MWRNREALLVSLLFAFVCMGSARAQDVSLLPTTLTFSNQVVGTTSAAQTLTLTNTDEENALAISGIVASGDFPETNNCVPGVAAGGSCTISVKFAPKATGAIDGSITISDNAGGSPQVLALKGTGITQETISPSSLNFGSVAVGSTSAIKTVTLTNHASSVIAVSITPSSGFTAVPAVSGGCGSSLAAKASCTEDVFFTPTELGAVDGSLIFADAGTQQYVALTGTGSGTADSPITLTPSTLAFGNQLVGATSADKSVVIKNTGATSLALTFAASGSFSKSNPASGACGSSLAGGASCTIDVQFTPAVLGSIDGGISVSYAGANSPQIVGLTGKGIGQVTVSPSSIAFPPQQVGTTSAAKVVTVKNNSSSAVTVSSITQSSDFTETKSCGASIAAGANCTISVKFAPNRGGVLLGSVIVKDSASNSPQIVDLSGSSFLVPRFAYVPNQADGTVSIYTVNAETGQLRSNGYAFAGTNPQQVTVDPSGRFAYVANEGSNSVSAFTINPSTGELTPTSDSPVATEDNPVSVTTDPSGKFLYVANTGSDNVSAYTIDGGTGALTAVSGSPFTAGELPNSVVVSPLGKFLYVIDNENSTLNSISAFTIDPTSGALNGVTGSPFAFPSTDGGRPTAAALSPAGNFLYVTSNNDSDVAAYSIDASSGALTLVPGSPYFVTDDCSSVTVAPSGNFLYLGGGATSFSVFEINTATGALTQLTMSPFASTSVNWLTLNPQGNILYVTGPNEVWSYTIDSATGVPTLSSINRTRQESTSLAIGGGTTGVTYTPTYAYVANQGSSTVASTVSAYKINASNGKLTAVSGSPFPDGGEGTFASSVTVDPSGSFAYVANDANSVAEYTIDSGSGALSAIGGSPIVDTNTPIFVTVDPSGRFVYVTNIQPYISAYAITPGAGTLAALSSSPVSTGGAYNGQTAAVDPTGQFLYVTIAASDQINGEILTFSIDPSSGALTGVGSPVTEGVNSPTSIVVDPSGRFAYVANLNVISATACGSTPCYLVSSYAIDATTGALTLLRFSPPVGAGTESLATDPLGQFIYGAQDGFGLVGLSFDSTTEEFTLLDVCSVSPSPVSIAVDPSGKFVYVANSGNANSVTGCGINQTTGNLHNISGEDNVAAGTTPVSVVTTGTIQ